MTVVGGSDTRFDMDKEIELPFEFPPAERGIFCSRTLNLRSIRAIGFDMDYTLIHYRPEVWEERAYEHARERLLERGWPVEDLSFDHQAVALGLIVDLELGNVVKANRFGYVKKAVHGLRTLEHQEMREAYSRVLIDLREPRWVFMNTLFGLSETCLFRQVVDLLDRGELEGTMGYGDLYRVVRSCVDETHMAGALKAEIAADPERFVVRDAELPLALLDLKHAGKRLLLITNSEWSYTRPMMSWAFDEHLPGDMVWSDLFDLVVVSSGKPGFFNANRPIFEIVNEEGLLQPVTGGLRDGGMYLGGNAALVEEHLDVPGEEILYVGDHIFADVNVSKSMLRWRTALVVRELEQEMAALEGFKEKQRALTEMMAKKELMEHNFSMHRIALQRLERGYGPQGKGSRQVLKQRMQHLRSELVALDSRIGPLAREAGQLANPTWGLLMRAGNDKSHLARQIERYADVYMSRVSNLLHYTPFVYLRSPRGSLPHDSGPAGGV